MTELPWTTLAATALIVALAYVVYGLTGFGASIVAIPLLAHIFPLRFAVPMMLLFDLGAGLLLGWRHHRIVDRALPRQPCHQPTFLVFDHFGYGGFDACCRKVGIVDTRNCHAPQIGFEYLAHRRFRQFWHDFDVLGR